MISWRTLWEFGGAGSAAVFGYRGDWTAMAITCATALLPVAWQVRAELAATRAMLREQAAAGKQRKPPQRAYRCSRCGGGNTVWSSEAAAAAARRLGFSLMCDTCLAGALRKGAAPGGYGTFPP